MNEIIKQRIDVIRQGKAPAGYKKTHIGVIPADWEKTRLGDCLIQHNEISEYSDQYPVLTSSRRGLYLQSEYYNKDIASEDNTGYNVVPYGYFTYRHMSDDEIFKFNINYLVPKGIVSTLYPVFTTTGNIDKAFLRELLNNGRDFKRYAILQKQGGSRTYMYFAKLQNLVVTIPPLPEQQKIAEILTTCDKVIELKEKRIIEKQKQKKYLMQQLLTGKKRLKGFTARWTTLCLRQIATKRKEKNLDFTYTQVLSNSAQHGVIPQEDQFDKDIANADKIDGYYIVKNGFFVYNPRISVTAPCGPINMNCTGITGVMSPLYTVFSVEDDRACNEYLKHYFNSNCWYAYMKSVANYGARHDRISVSDEDFFSMPIQMPNTDEQHAISGFLSQADHEIELLQRDLEQEKLKKKALMQLLLTGIVRVCAE